MANYVLHTTAGDIEIETSEYVDIDTVDFIPFLDIGHLSKAIKDIDGKHIDKVIKPYLMLISDLANYTMTVDETVGDINHILGNGVDLEAAERTLRTLHKILTILDRTQIGTRIEDSLLELRKGIGVKMDASSINNVIETMANNVVYERDPFLNLTQGVWDAVVNKCGGEKGVEREINRMIATMR